MSRYRFPGHPEYLARAAGLHGLPVSAADEARRQPALTRLANLVAQATDADAAHRPGILAEARKSRDALAVALDAAEAALADAHAGLGLPAPDFVVGPEDVVGGEALKAIVADLETRLAAETARADAAHHLLEAATAPAKG